MYRSNLQRPAHLRMRNDDSQGVGLFWPTPSPHEFDCPRKHICKLMSALCLGCGHATVQSAVCHVTVQYRPHISSVIQPIASRIPPASPALPPADYSCPETKEEKENKEEE